MKAKVIDHPSKKGDKPAKPLEEIVLRNGERPGNWYIKGKGIESVTHCDEGLRVHYRTNGERQTITFNYPEGYDFTSEVVLRENGMLVVFPSGEKASQSQIAV